MSSTLPRSLRSLVPLRLAAAAPRRVFRPTIDFSAAGPACLMSPRRSGTLPSRRSASGQNTRQRRQGACVIRQQADTGPSQPSVRELYSDHADHRQHGRGTFRSLCCRGHSAPSPLQLANGDEAGAVPRRRMLRPMVDLSVRELPCHDVAAVTTFLSATAIGQHRHCCAAAARVQANNRSLGNRTSLSHVAATLKNTANVAVCEWSDEPCRTPTSAVKRRFTEMPLGELP